MTKKQRLDIHQIVTDQIIANPPVVTRPMSRVNRIAPTKTQKKRVKRDSDRAVRDALLRADFTPGFVGRITITKARQILTDIAAGKGAMREDMI
jgi:hypothetical protein